MATNEPVLFASPLETQTLVTVADVQSAMEACESVGPRTGTHSVQIWSAPTLCWLCYQLGL